MRYDTKEKIQKYVRKHLSLKNCAVRAIRRGLIKHNKNFLIIENDKKYVFRTRLERSDAAESEDTLYNEHIIYTFLKQENILFVPKSVLFDRKNNIHIIEYVSGKDIFLGDLNEKMQKKFVDQLVTIHKLSFKKFELFCKKHNFPSPKLETHEECFKKYGTDLLENIQTYANAESDFINWAIEKIKINEKLLPHIPTGSPLLSHGDLAGNMRLDTDTLWFIDWELARFNYNHELAYMFEFGRCSEESKKRILDLYIERNEMSKKDVHKMLTIHTQILRVNSALWAYRKYLQFCQEKNPDAIAYKKIANDKRKNYESFVRSL